MLLFIAIIVFELSCQPSQRLTPKILGMHRGTELGWYSKSTILFDTDSTFLIYSSEALMDSQMPGICPKSLLTLSDQRIYTIQTDNSCIGGEPPKGNRIRLVNYPYQLVPFFYKQAIVVLGDTQSYVLYVIDFKNLGHGRYIIELSTKWR